MSTVKVSQHADLNVEALRGMSVSLDFTIGDGTTDYSTHECYFTIYNDAGATVIDATHANNKAEPGVGVIALRLTRDDMDIPAGVYSYVCRFAVGADDDPVLSGSFIVLDKSKKVGW